MALALKPAPAPYRDLSGGLGVDRIGGALVTAIKAWEAAYQASEDGDGWRVIDWGDGLAASGSTLGVHGFTSNGGLGYATAAAVWSASAGGANSISNPLAWFCIGEYVEGVATGREITFTRGSAATAGGERFLTVMETPTPCTGAITPTAPRSTGGNQRFHHGTAFGAAGNNWITNGANLIATATTFVWVPLVAERAINGRVAAGILLWNSTTPTHESGFLTLPLVECADTDPYPFATMCGTWLECFGGTTTFNTTPGTFGSTVSKMGALDAAGVWRNAAFATMTLADSTARPGTSGNVILADKDGDFWLVPAYVSLDNVTGVQCEPKGVACDAFKLALVANSTHRFPTTLHSSVADATEVPRLLLGQVAITSELLYVPDHPTVANQTTWRSLGNDAVDAVEDSTPPTTTLISPVSLTEISRTDPIVLELDDDTGIELFVIFCVYPTLGMVEVVIDGGDLDLETSYTITPSTVLGKQRYSVLRTGGWPAPGYLRSRLIDARGNQS